LLSSFSLLWESSRGKTIQHNQDTEVLLVDSPAIRLDKYLASKYPGQSRSNIQRLIRQGSILVNELGAKASQEVHAGDTIRVTFPPPEPESPLPEPIPLKIVYEDNDLIIVDKPAGMTVHPAPGHTAHTLVNAILAHCPDITGIGDPVRPGIVHRLDKDTSGLLIVAKHASAQQHLINQFKSRSVLKCYLVLVKGRPEPAKGIIEAPVGRAPYNRKRMAVVDGGRYARTAFTVKEYLDDHALLEVTIETGRTHQIRVHLAAINYPVVGDRVYGVKSPLLNRQFVHSYKLGFSLPSDGSYREFISDLPPDLIQAMALIRNL
jgi:23S rRNA pseudouridine1911/1915/1917 synthase